MFLFWSSQDTKIIQGSTLQGLRHLASFFPSSISSLKLVSSSLEEGFSEHTSRVHSCQQGKPTTAHQRWATLLTLDWTLLLERCWWSSPVNQQELGLTNSQFYIFETNVIQHVIRRLPSSSLFLSFWIEKHSNSHGKFRGRDKTQQTLMFDVWCKFTKGQFHK